MRYLSVCSGIEAATVAWQPLGWTAAGFAEIEKFPSAVLAHRYGSNMPGDPLASNGVPNFGNFTEIQPHNVGPIDLLVGGTPCQSFSIAGLRGGLDDDRGNLALEFCRLAQRTRPSWIVWENVPGVLSMDGGDAFASILGGLAECGYGLAYRVLDAQYVRVDGFARAVPQRRRRVFVVGYLGDWRRAAAVLFEPEGMRRNTPPRRQAGKGIAPTLSARTKGGGGLGTDFDCDGGLIPCNDLGGVSHALTAKHSATDRYDPNGETFVSHALRGEGFDASEDGTGRRTPLVPVAFSCKDHGADASDDLAPTMRAMGHDGSHANAGGQLAIAIQERAICENPSAGPDGSGIRDDGASYTLESRTVPQAVAFDTTQITSPENRCNPKPDDPCHPLAAGAHPPTIAYVQERMAVRRLTPLECERLQGFPDGYTQVPYRKKLAADGPRYKALGNSMAVNCMRWIGARINAAA